MISGTNKDIALFHIVKSISGYYNRKIKSHDDCDDVEDSSILQPETDKETDKPIPAKPSKKKEKKPFDFDGWGGEF